MARFFLRQFALTVPVVLKQYVINEVVLTEVEVVVV